MKKVILIISLCLFSIVAFADYDWNLPAKRIYDGILFACISSENPNQNVYCLRIDTSKNLKFYTTPRIEDNYIDGERETWRVTVRESMRKFQSDNKLMLVAVNNDFFSPWPPKNAIDPANLCNFAVSDGVVVSSPGECPCFVVTKDGKCLIKHITKDTDISDIWVACGSSQYCLKDGVVVPGEVARHPRTVCGVSKDNRYVYLMVIDGRRHASVGATIEEEGKWLKYFGAYDGINFDGGGSSTMVYWDLTEKEIKNRCKLLNQPNSISYNKKTIEEENAEYYIQERRVANILGVYVEK